MPHTWHDWIWMAVGIVLVSVHLAAMTDELLHPSEPDDEDERA